jgi:hypothetical protein
VPAQRPWYPWHSDFFPWSLSSYRVDQFGNAVTPEHFWTRLCRYETAAAAVVGFPSASISSLDNPICFRSPVYVESLRLTSGDSSLGRNGFWREEAADDDLHTMASVLVGWSPVMRAQLSPVVLKHCFITAYQGTGVVVEPDSRLALLDSVVVNCLLLPMAVKKESVVRVAGSHLIMCMGAIQTGRDAYIYEPQLRSAPDETHTKVIAGLMSTKDTP